MNDQDRAGTRSMLALDGVRHRYDRTEVVAVEHWQVAEGEQWLLHGPSGCGKSTLLHIMAGLLTPSQGTVRLAGQDLGALAGAARDRFRGRHVGIVFQQLHLIDALTVRQNLVLAQSLAGLPPNEARVGEMLDGLRIADKADARPFALSYGQAQRVALARALINRPQLLLADEPTSNLDDANAERALALLRDQAEAQGSALVVASHDGRIKDTFERRLELDIAAEAQAA
ncbi:MAG TPA: ABC transporter ATP-binding protein [Alphaproteobacteria bacterium]